MEVSRFEEKLNKVDGNVYVVEEKVFLTEGVYIRELKHDNINQTTLAVYTGPRLTGERIQTFALSTPSLTPWKRRIKVYASAPEVYITYETDGDTVEAEDVNQLQVAMSKTQTAVNTEYERATKAEEVQRKELDAEIQRAQEVEAELAELVNEERVRAETEESILSYGLDSETMRAVEKEIGLENRLLSETERAKEAEIGLKKTIDTNKSKWDDKYTKNEVDIKFSEHISEDDPHNVTPEQIGLGDVENKSGAAIRAEMTKEEVVKALGYTPPASSVAYTHPDSGAEAGTYRSVTVNSQGHVTGGANPTTLGEYGTTDAMSTGPFTWDQLKGV